MSAACGKPLFAVQLFKQAGESGNRRRRAVFIAPYTARSGDEVGSRLDQGRGIIGGDAANGDAGQFDKLLPEGQKLGFGAGLGVFCLRLVKRTKGDIIGARFARFHGEVFAVMAGDADNRLIA